MTTLYDVLLDAKHRLMASSETAAMDAEILLAFVLKKSRTYLYTHADKAISKPDLQTFTQFIETRLQGQPIAYLIRKRDFWSLSLTVSEDTLIPRPETELLVERALHHLKNIPEARVLDLGTGSGAIALAIAKERPDCNIWAVDINPNTLEIAKYNAAQHHLSNLQFYQSDWFSDLPHESLFHLIVSNPPYLAENDPHLTQGDLRFEPSDALISGPTGLEAFKQLIHTACSHLIHNGWLCLEHGAMQKSKIGSMLNKCTYCEINTFTDYQGHDRVTEGCFKKQT